MCAGRAWPWTLQKRGTDAGPHAGSTTSHGGGREGARTPPRAKGDTGRWARENQQGAALRPLPKRGAPGPPQTQCRPDRDLKSQFTKWKRVAGVVFRQREKRPRAERAGCIQETGCGEGQPEGGVHGESECGASRLARHGAPGHKGPGFKVGARVQGRRAVTLCWRQSQPHGCWRGWRGSHEGAGPGEGRRIAVAEARPLLRSASGPRTTHTSQSLGPQPVRRSSPPAPLSSAAAAAAAVGKRPEQRPGRPSIWQRGAHGGGGLSRGRWRAWVSPAPADTCEADCVRRRAEQSLQATIKTLRKSLSRQHFSVQVAGTEYELAQRPAKAPEGPGTCGPGHAPQDGKCGESLPAAPPVVCLCPSSPGHSPRGRQTRREGTGNKEAPPRRST